jgi:hypothetical protein
MWAFACEFGDGSTEKQTKTDIPCGMRFPNLRNLEYHIQNSHTPEGLSRKLQSESKLASFFEAQKVAFDRNFLNHINFKGCKNIEGNKYSARPDFFLPEESARLSAVVLVGNDEFAHRQYACDFQRVFNITNALEQTHEFKGVPILYVRFNPHFYRKDDVLFDMPLTEAHERLLNEITRTKKEELIRPVNLIYVNYDSAEGQLKIFSDNNMEENDYCKLFEDSVLRWVN